MSQTIGSASSSLAAGTIFTIPRSSCGGSPRRTQVALLALPRGHPRHLRDGAAAAPADRAQRGRAAVSGRHRLRAGAEGDDGHRRAGAGSSTASPPAPSSSWRSAALAFLPSELRRSPCLPERELALEIAPALMGVGYILGYRQSAIMVAGSLISSLALIPLIALVGAGLTAPLFPEPTLTISAMSASQIWSRYVRYIGAGAVAVAGIVTVIRALPDHVPVAARRSLARPAQGRTVAADGRAVPRTDRDVPGWVVLAGPALVVLTLFAMPGPAGGSMSAGPRLVAASASRSSGSPSWSVSSRIVGLIGVSSNPTSGMALVTLLGVSLVFVALGWTDALRARRHPHGRHRRLRRRLEGGRHLAGPEDGAAGRRHAGPPAARPVHRRRVRLLGGRGHRVRPRHAYRFGSAELPAPQATLMKTVIEGVLAGALPWGLVGTGATFSLGAMLSGLPGLALRDRHLPAARQPDARSSWAGSCGASWRRGARGRRRRAIPACWRRPA